MGIRTVVRKTSLFLFAAPLVWGQLPVRGLHLSAPAPQDVPLMVRFIQDALPKEGVNTLVLEINYHYKFQRRPEMTDTDPLSADDAKQIAAACRQAGVRIIPLVNLLGHQSWAKTTFTLLRSHPEFDETPGKYPDNQGIYCRSYCPLHPAVHQVVFDVIDEIADAFQADALHVGMDEVFLLGEPDCPRCRGKLKSDLFAGEVRTLRDHLAKANRTMWMWGDRFLDGTTTGVGEWEGSYNGTYPALQAVPTDIVIADWHYEQATPTAAHFALAGFNVVSCPWRDQKVALGQLDLIRSVRAHAGNPVAPRMAGVLETSWMPSAPFIRAYYGEETTQKSVLDVVNCFRTLFTELRKGGL